MLSTPRIQYQNQENANSVSRKPTLNQPLRKAFGERDINLKNEPLRSSEKLKAKRSPFESLNTPNAKAKRSAFESLHTPNAKAKTPVPKVKQSETKYPDWMLDVCSYKTVPDTYVDILTERPSREAMARSLKSFISCPAPKEPPSMCELFEMFTPPILSEPSTPKQLPKLNFDFDFVNNVPLPDVKFTDFDY